MRTNELFHCYANEHVAAAAIACIGGTFERRVASAARKAGLTSGAYIVELLKEFDRRASPKRRKLLERGMDRHDMPILAGLRHIVETALVGAWEVVKPEHGGGRKTLALRVDWASPAAVYRKSVDREARVH
jgi:hypothetical protein